MWARRLGVVLLLAGSLASSFAASSFTGLGFLPGATNSSAHAVSANGKVVVGSSKSASGYEAFRWTASGGMVGLGFLPGGRGASIGLGVSGDGKVIVGISDSAKGQQPFRWTAAEGMTNLSSLASEVLGGAATAVSADGKTVVGMVLSTKSGFQLFHWTAKQGMMALCELPVGGTDNNIEISISVSKDGSVVVGTKAKPSGTKAIRRSDWRGGLVEMEGKTYDAEAFRWSARNGIVGLGCLPGGTNSRARIVSSDGRLVAGYSDSALGGEIFRWTSASGMVGLGKMPGNLKNAHVAITGRDLIIIGTSEAPKGKELFIWDKINAMRSLNTVLTSNYHLDLTGWSLTRVARVTDDGKTIVGDGYHNGHTEAWVAHLDRPLNETGRKKERK